MAKLILSAELEQYAGGTRVISISAANYRDLVVELRQRFPAMPAEIISKHALAIDGAIIHTPLLETFSGSSELVFVPRIAGG